MAFLLSGSVQFIVTIFLIPSMSVAAAPAGNPPLLSESVKGFDHQLEGILRRGDGEATTQDPSSYANLSEYSWAMTAHIVCMIVAWVFVLPIGTDNFFGVTLPLKV